jgi:hypothetical protein
VDLRVEQRKLKRECNALEIQIKDAIKDREGLSWEGNALTWRRTKDSESVNWEALATGLLQKFVTDELVRAELKIVHTNVKDGHRRIHVNHPLLNRAKRGGAEQETEEEEVAI